MTKSEILEKVVKAGFPYAPDTVANVDCFERLLMAERELMAKRLETDNWLACAAILRGARAE